MVHTVADFAHNKFQKTENTSSFLDFLFKNKNKHTK